MPKGNIGNEEFINHHDQDFDKERDLLGNDIADMFTSISTK